MLPGSQGRLYSSGRLAKPNIADEWAGLAALPRSHGAALYLSERLVQPNVADEWAGLAALPGSPGAALYLSKRLARELPVAARVSAL